MRALCIFASPSVVDHSQIDLVVNPSTALPSITSVPQLAFNITAAPTGVNGATNPFAATNSSNLVNSASVARACTASSENITASATAPTPNAVKRLVWTMNTPSTQAGAVVYPGIEIDNLGCIAGTNSGNLGNFKYTWYLVSGTGTGLQYDATTLNTLPTPLLASRNFNQIDATDLGSSYIGKRLLCVIEQNTGNPCPTSNNPTNRMYAYAVFSDVLGQLQMPGNGPQTNSVGKERWTIYPNPAKSRLTIKCLNQNIEAQKVLIVDHLGRKVRVVSCNAEGSQVNISKLPIGLYRILKEDSMKTLGSFLKH